MIGKKVEVLFEEEENGLYKGHTSNYILVNAKSEEDIIDKIKTVRIIDLYKELEVIGEVID